MKKTFIIIVVFLIASFLVFGWSEQIVKSQQGFWLTPVAIVLAILICSPAFLAYYLNKKNIVIKNIFWGNIKNGSLAISALACIMIASLGIGGKIDALLNFETLLGGGYGIVMHSILLMFISYSTVEKNREQKFFEDIEKILLHIKEHAPSPREGIFRVNEQAHTIEELRKQMREKTPYGTVITERYWLDKFMEYPIGNILEATG